MTHQIQCGAMMVYQSANLQSLAVESEPYCRNWRSLGTVESSGLDRRVRAKGWSLFFMAGEITTLVPGWEGHNALRRGAKRLLSQIRLQYFNCLEVTDISRKYYLGVPYLTISANPRHIQEDSQIDSMAQRAQDSSVEAQTAN